MNIFFNENEQRLRAGWRLLLQFILMVVITGIGAVGAQFFFPGSLMLVSTAASFIGITASIWIAAHYLDKRPFEEYGLHFNRRWWKECMLGTGIGAAAVGLMFLAEWYEGWLTISDYGWDESFDVSFVMGLATSFFTMLMVGFYEELFSRGYQILNITEGLRYPDIGTPVATSIAVLLTSSLFGILHLFNPNASLTSTFNIILAGVVLALPYILTGRLALSMGLHFSWNFVMGGIFGFPVSGQTFETSVLQIQQGGTEVWTGGAFGPEAGMISWLGMAIMTGGVYVYIKTTERELAIADIFKKSSVQS